MAFSSPSVMMRVARPLSRCRPNKLRCPPACWPKRSCLAIPGPKNRYWTAWSVPSAPNQGRVIAGSASRRTGMPGVLETQAPGLPGLGPEPAVAQVSAGGGAVSVISQAALSFLHQRLRRALPRRLSPVGHGHRPRAGAHPHLHVRNAGRVAHQELDGRLKGDLLPALHVVDGIPAARGALPAVPLAGRWDDVKAIRAPAEGTGTGVLAAVGVGDADQGRVRFDQAQQVHLARLGDLCLKQSCVRLRVWLGGSLEQRFGVRRTHRLPVAWGSFWAAGGTGRRRKARGTYSRQTGTLRRERNGDERVCSSPWCSQASSPAMG